MQPTTEQEHRLSRLISDWQEKLSASDLQDPFVDTELAALRDTVWQASDFVAQSSLREPEMVLALLKEGLLDTPYQPGGMAAALDALLADVADEAQLSSLLRRFRRKQMVRIIWRDICRQFDDVTGVINDIDAHEPIAAVRCQPCFVQFRDGQVIAISAPGHAARPDLRAASGCEPGRTIQARAAPTNPGRTAAH